MDCETIIVECLVCGVSSNCIKKRLFSSLASTELSHIFKLISGLDEIYQTDYLCAACIKSLKLVSKFYETCLQSKLILLRKQPLLGDLKTCIEDKTKSNNKTDTNQSSKSNEQKDDISLFKWPSLSPKASSSNSVKDDDGSEKKFFSPTKEESTDVASIDSDWFHEMKERVKRRIYYCEECDNGINSNVQWLKHLKKTHHSQKNSEKTFICDHCGKAWGDSQNFLDHVRTHTQEAQGKPFQCNHCSTRFAHQRTLKKHIRSHIRNFKCEQCKKAFNFDDALKEHIKRVHQQIYKFFCETCPSKFFDKQALDCHKKIHSGSKECQCPYCEETFYSSSERNSHYRKQHGKPVPKGNLATTKAT